MREADGAVSCAYYDAELRTWELKTQSHALPAGWKVGPRVDEALDAWIATQIQHVGLSQPLPPEWKVPPLIHETHKGMEP